MLSCPSPGPRGLQKETSLHGWQWCQGCVFAAWIHGASSHSNPAVRLHATHSCHIAQGRRVLPSLLTAAAGKTSQGARSWTPAGRGAARIQPQPDPSPTPCKRCSLPPSGGAAHREAERGSPPTHAQSLQAELGATPPTHAHSPAPKDQAPASWAGGEGGLQGDTARGGRRPHRWMHQDSRWRCARL